VSTTPNTMTAPIALNSGAVERPYSLPVGKPFERFGGPSRTTQYQLIAAREIQSFLVGSRRYVVIQSWVDFVERQRQKDTANRAKGGKLLMRGEAR
jgi:hypothetical protein